MCQTFHPKKKKTKSEKNEKLKHKRNGKIGVKYLHNELRQLRYDIYNVRGRVDYLISFLNSYKAGELRYNGVLLAGVDDERLHITFDHLAQSVVTSHV